MQPDLDDWIIPCPHVQLFIPLNKSLNVAGDNCRAAEGGSQGFGGAPDKEQPAAARALVSQSIIQALDVLKRFWGQ